MNPRNLITEILSMHPRQQISPEILEALQGAFSSYIYNKTPLEEGLFLKQTRISDRLKKEARDRHLKRAAKQIIAPNVTQKAIRLEAAILTFESLIWPKWEFLEMPPLESSLLRMNLFYAKRACSTLPKYKQLIRII